MQTRLPVKYQGKQLTEMLAQVAILREVIPEGMDINELIKCFKAGWQLVPPPPSSKIIEDIIDEFLASP